MGIYLYKKSIDTRIVKAVADVLRVMVIDCKKLKQGEINHVYKLTTTTGVIVARVFRYKNLPEEGKLQWIEGQLTKHDVPHAKLLYYTRDNKYFPNGFMISEFVDGLNGWDAIKYKHHTLMESYEETGKILRKVHEIKIEKYGPVNNGKGKYTDFVKMQLGEIKDKLSLLYKRKALDFDCYPEVAKIVTNSIGPYQKVLHPVLLHGDASRENSILNTKREFVLIDWDNAWSGIWLWDFIEVSWWHLHLRGWMNNSARRLEARKAFFKGYGKVTLSDADINTIERGLHVIKSIDKLHYYFFDKKDDKNFRLVKNKFLKFLR